MKKAPRVNLPIPGWAGAVYLLFCLVMIPWTAYMSWELPTRHISRHWDVSWVGLDIVITLALLLTGILAWRKSKWVAITSTAAGTLLIVDAWFDILSSRPGIELFEALLLALIFELPIAVMSYILAFHVLDKNLR